jgi:hypothetical protein
VTLILIENWMNAAPSPTNNKKLAKTLGLIGRSIDEHLGGQDVAEWHEHLSEFCVAEFLRQMVDERKKNYSVFGYNCVCGDLQISCEFTHLFLQISTTVIITKKRNNLYQICSVHGSH